MAVAAVTGEAGGSDENAVIELRRAGEIVRLANRLHGLPHDPAARKRELLHGIVRLVGARAGTCVVALAADDAPVLLSSAHARGGSSRQGATANAANGGASGHADPVVHDLLRRLFPKSSRGGPARSHADGAWLVSTVRLDNRNTAAAIALTRDGHGNGANGANGDARPFDRVDRALVDLVHYEMRWVYALDLPLASPDVMPLSNRAKQTLQLLLAGNSEKQIAGHLGLSLNTVHHYVKQLYRHFGVTTRSELMARWLRAKRPADPKPPRRRASR